MAARYRLIAHRWRRIPNARRGDVIDVPEADVDRLLRAGAIEPVSGVAEVAAPAPVVVDPKPVVEQDPEPDAVERDDEPDPADDPADDDAAVTTRPKQVADKSVWVKYAIHHGYTRARAEDMTKRELIAALP